MMIYVMSQILFDDYRYILTQILSYIHKTLACCYIYFLLLYKILLARASNLGLNNNKKHITVLSYIY